MSENELIRITNREWVGQSDEEHLEFLQNGTIQTQQVGQRSVQAIIVYKNKYKEVSPPREDVQDVISYAKRQRDHLIELLEKDLKEAKSA